LENDPRTILNDLPQHLSERTRVLNGQPVAKNGAFVLYWMHHAVRGHENPALDAALWVADRLELPVLVYQGLGGCHRYNSDRHHTFILEGARDVEKELKRRGITYCFHLAEEPRDSAPLRGLMTRAALSLTEAFPAPPFNRWTKYLAAISPSSFWAVDTACILPMQRVEKQYARAFQFRKATWGSFQKRMSQAYIAPAVTVRPFDGKLGFDPLNLASADIADCCARCRIDHTVGPVSHTPGGSRAGYDRWEQFEQHGLGDYADSRNDAAIPFPSGVSRMSAYLHHGHVSPFRIVRQAASSNARGAQKYLDEILIWRELAHHFCFYHDYPETLDVLPAWAQETLEDHRQDPRESVYTWETLARAQTGDPLWDAAQQSLLIHGELHNNLRMTWGKELLQWTRTPQEALQMMIDLNHRFALDGSDPNSYAGILWCLGLFDRPFTPPRPIIGTIRPRSTRSHAERLNLERYTVRVSRPAGGYPLRVAVIGAGLSGLVAARTLTDHGHRVRVFEKARGLGGRLATRRWESYAFDHGAQYFTARDDRFLRWVDSWRATGMVRRWEGRIGVLRAGAFQKENRRHDRWVGVPGMSALAGHLAQDLDVHLGTCIRHVRKDAQGTVLIDDNGQAWGGFDALVVTVPPEQGAALLDDRTPLAGRLRAITMSPCWAVMLAFAKPLDLPLDGAFVHDSEIAWAARNSSKPERQHDECWVLHATAAWSADNMTMRSEAVISGLLQSFSAAAGLSLPDPVFATAHRWRYAQAPKPLTAGCLWDGRSMVGICGDWCCGSRIEGAFLSGAAMAGRIIADIP
jgi:photolyase PhrII